MILRINPANVNLIATRALSEIYSETEIANGSIEKDPSTDLNVDQIKSIYLLRLKLEKYVL